MCGCSCCCCCCCEDDDALAFDDAEVKTPTNSTEQVKFPVSSQPQCYYPNGMVYAPSIVCNNSTKYSTCCGSAGDGVEWECLTNNLCKNTSDISTKYERGGCSDPSWKSPECANVCLDSGTVTLLFLSQCCALLYCSSADRLSPSTWVPRKRLCLY
jgi:hypothetical protein